jgi:hypothetical protein
MIDAIKGIIQLLVILLSFPTIHFYELCRDVFTGVCKFGNVKYVKGERYGFGQSEFIVLSIGIVFWALIITGGYCLIF